MLTILLKHCAFFFIDLLVVVYIKHGLFHAPMSNAESIDIKRILDEILRKTANLVPSTPSENKSMNDSRVSKPSNSIVVAPPGKILDDSAFGGDPRNSYRELRRYLLDIGIDSRIFSFGSIPIPLAITESRKSMPTIAVDIGSFDNCFFFEMRKVIESGSFGEKVNTLVIMFRVFFEGSQDSSNFWVQAVMNHHRDAILELNRIYRKVIPSLISNAWTQPTAGRESTRVTYLEKRFTDVTEFKHEFNTMHRMYREHGMRGNNIEPHS